MFVSVHSTHSPGGAQQEPEDIGEAKSPSSGHQGQPWPAPGEVLSEAVLELNKVITGNEGAEEGPAE